MIKLKFFIIEGSVVNLFQRKSSLVILDETELTLLLLRTGISTYSR